MINLGAIYKINDLQDLTYIKAGYFSRLGAAIFIGKNT